MASDSEKNQPVVVERDGGIVYTYTNRVDLDWTAHDIRIMFSEYSLLPNFTPGGQKERMEKRASIAMAWSQAKSLHDLLGRALQNYENLNGPIIQKPGVPPSLP